MYRAHGIYVYIYIYIPQVYTSMYHAHRNIFGTESHQFSLVLTDIFVHLQAAVTPVLSDNSCNSYATCLPVTPLALMPLSQQLRYFPTSYATLPPVTPLSHQLHHLPTSCATLPPVTLLYHQLRHFNTSYTTFPQVTPLARQNAKAQNILRIKYSERQPVSGFKLLCTY